jgi:hypothetical protein
MKSILIKDTTKEERIAEINMEFNTGFYEEVDTKQAPGCDRGSGRR